MTNIFSIVLFMISYPPRLSAVTSLVFWFTATSVVQTGDNENKFHFYKLSLDNTLNEVIPSHGNVALTVYFMDYWHHCP